MGITHSVSLAADLQQVFDWHARPGAMTRLTPPWTPMTVQRESASLRDGQAVLSFPGGLRWVAQHQPSGYRPPHAFVDELTSQPFRSFVSWRHEHEFAAEGDRTRITDHVQSAVPAAMLRPMFEYRYRQLVGDLAAHAWAASHEPGPLTVAITGSSGLVGRQLAAFLSTGGHRVIRLVRHAARHPDERRWLPHNPDPELLDGIDAVIHLAGASIAGRFTGRHKQSLRDSRIEPTRRLADVAARATDGPSSFITASAIGIYGPDRGDEILTETSAPGEGFLADLVVDWEQAAASAADAGLRTVQVRTGIVQTPAGGVLQIFHPQFAVGLGGRLGGGRQWMSWIGIDDLLDVYLRALVDPELRGPVNAAAPHPQRNVDYASQLAQVLRRPALLPTPALGPQVLLGREGAIELAQASQLVQPQRLIEAGHVFRWPDLTPALSHVLGREIPARYRVST